MEAAAFCRQWYDKFVFPDAEEPRRVWEALVDQMIAAVDEAGIDVVSVDWEFVGDELLALRLELFGTAYAHRTREKVPLGLAETTTTKQYLTERGRSDLWDRMLVYNKTVATGPKTRGTHAVILMLDEMRLSLSKDYAKLGADPDCAVRALNRIGTSVDFLKIAPIRLGHVLAGQVNIPPSDGLVIVLNALAQGFYNGARESLDEVEFRT